MSSLVPTFTCRYITIMWNKDYDEEVFVLTEADGWFEAQIVLDRAFKNFRNSGWKRGGHFYVTAESDYLKNTMSVEKFIEVYAHG